MHICILSRVFGSWYWHTRSVKLILVRCDLFLQRGIPQSLYAFPVLQGHSVYFVFLNPWTCAVYGLSLEIICMVARPWTNRLWRILAHDHWSGEIIFRGNISQHVRLGRGASACFWAPSENGYLKVFGSMKLLVLGCLQCVYSVLLFHRGQPGEIVQPREEEEAISFMHGHFKLTERIWWAHEMGLRKVDTLPHGDCMFIAVAWSAGLPLDCHAFRQEAVSYVATLPNHFRPLDWRALQRLSSFPAAESWIGKTICVYRPWAIFFFDQSKWWQIGQQQMKHFWWWSLVIVSYTGWKHYEGTEEV